MTPLEKRHFIIDVEAIGGVPGLHNSLMTEFGVVDFDSFMEGEIRTFHGILVDSVPSVENPAVPMITPDSRYYDAKRVATDLGEWLQYRGTCRPIAISDNIAYDFPWIAHLMFEQTGDNPFGHSGRRIGDFAAGLQEDWNKQSKWKGLRRTKHDHNPVNDSLGNAEALKSLLDMIEYPW